MSFSNLVKYRGFCWEWESSLVCNNHQNNVFLKRKKSHSAALGKEGKLHVLKTLLPFKAVYRRGRNLLRVRITGV